MVWLIIRNNKNKQKFTNKTLVVLIAQRVDIELHVILHDCSSSSYQNNPLNIMYIIAIKLFQA